MNRTSLLIDLNYLIDVDCIVLGRNVNSFFFVLVAPNANQMVNVNQQMMNQQQQQQVMARKLAMEQQQLQQQQAQQQQAQQQQVQQQQAQVQQQQQPQNLNFAINPGNSNLGMQTNMPQQQMQQQQMQQQPQQQPQQLNVPVTPATIVQQQAAPVAAAPAAARERQVIWQGVLEWQEKTRDPQKLPRHVPCQVSAAVTNGESEVSVFFFLYY